MTSSSKAKVGFRVHLNLGWLSASVCLLVPAVAGAQAQQDVQAQLDALAKQQALAEPAKAPPPAEPLPPAELDGADSLPGSSRPSGFSTSPEAPPTPAAPGGRAPSFGAPSDPDAWNFRIGGRISGYGQVGLGRTPSDTPGRDMALHTPPLIVGRQPFYAGPGGTLTFQYGNQTISAFASLEAYLTGQDREGYYRNENGPRIRTAYIAATPAPIGDWRLRFQVGAFPSNYGAPGPWGWGVFGPVLAVHGYGGNATVERNLTPTSQLYLEYGITGVPLVDEAVVRGTFTDWPEAGLSTIVNHGHAGITFNNKYSAKLHYARAQGRNLRTYLDDVGGTGVVERLPDGHMDVAALELRWQGDPYGQLGITPVFWNFNRALGVHNGVWWGMDWTAGGREMSRKFLGPNSLGTGKIFAISAEYDFSLMRILKAPAPFDGNGHDLRVALAVLPFWTLDSKDADFDKTSGYYLGATFEHVLLSWLSTGFMVYGESRDSATVDVSGNTVKGRWLTYSGTAGLILHSDWQSQDRIVLAYSRYFYSDFTDSNSVRPLDRDVFTLGGSVAF